MTGSELGYYIHHFVKLNPKKNKRPNLSKYNQNSFFVIQNSFKENKKYIITSNYDDVFYYKNEKLIGKKWIDIILSSKDIFEYHKIIRDEFPYCKQKKFLKILIENLFFWFDKNMIKVIVEASEVNFDIDTRKKLENIRYFLDKKDWSNYFFNLQKLMHEQIIKLLDWKNKSLNYNSYIEILNQKLSSYINDLNIIKNCNETIRQINLYRNLLSKATSIIPNNNVQWNSISSDFTKKLIAWKLYYLLAELINCFNLILQEKKL